MNATISEADKIRIKQYLLGKLAEADEETVEVRLMSDPAFSEEFDITVDEIATLYVTRQFTGEEKTRVEQYFLRSPERRKRVQFICELLRQINGNGDDKSVVVPVDLENQRPTVWQRTRNFLAQPSLRFPALSFAALLIVGGLIFWVISLSSTPIYQSFELAMTTTSERSAGTGIKNIHLESRADRLRIKLIVPTPAASQYRASLQGEHVSLPQLTIETQDSESITVIISADDISRGTYAIQLVEINNGQETPLRGTYQFTVD